MHRCRAVQSGVAVADGHFTVETNNHLWQLRLGQFCAGFEVVGRALLRG